jgi:hypothetical protein
MHARDVDLVEQLIRIQGLLRPASDHAYAESSTSLRLLGDQVWSRERCLGEWIGRDDAGRGERG